MIGYQNICGFGTLPSPMRKANSPKVGAFPPEAFSARCRDHPSGKQSIVDFQAIDIVIFRLLDKRQQSSHRGGLRQLLTLDLNHLRAIFNNIRNASQTRIVSEPFQWSTGYLFGFGKFILQAF